MLTALKKSTPYIIFMSMVAFIKLFVRSLHMNMTGNNTRERSTQVAVHWSQELMDIVDAHVRIDGTQPVLEPHRCYIVISNHASLYDIPAAFIGIKANLRMIAKKELFRIPFLGAAMRYHEFIGIDRSNRNQAILDLQTAKARMESGIVVWAAAEGTRSRTGELLPFKKGIFMLALQAKAVIIPIYIEGTGNILPAKTLHFNTGETVTVKIAPCIDTQHMKETEREALMQRVRRYMLAMQKNTIADIPFHTLDQG